jgi:hypothetical protein
MGVNESEIIYKAGLNTALLCALIVGYWTSEKCSLKPCLCNSEEGRATQQRKLEKPLICARWQEVVLNFTLIRMKREPCTRQAQRGRSCRISY